MRSARSSRPRPLVSTSPFLSPPGSCCGGGGAPARSGGSPAESNVSGADPVGAAPNLVMEEVGGGGQHRRRWISARLPTARAHRGLMTEEMGRILRLTSGPSPAGGGLPRARARFGQSGRKSVFMLGRRNSTATVTASGCRSYATRCPFLQVVQKLDSTPASASR
jgi:hypothetical protein